MGQLTKILREAYFKDRIHIPLNMRPRQNELARKNV